MKTNKLFLMLALVALAFGFFAFTHATRTKDYCIVSTMQGLSKLSVSVNYGNNRKEDMKFSYSTQENETVDLFNKLNNEGWELKGLQSIESNVQGSSAGISTNYIFERNHQE